jgi:hypothetical protein
MIAYYITINASRRARRAITQKRNHGCKSADKTAKAGAGAAVSKRAIGQSGNPQGRPAGARNAATRLAEAMLRDEASTLTRTLLDVAYGGDRSLLKAAFHTAVPRALLRKIGRGAGLTLQQLGDSRQRQEKHPRILGKRQKAVMAIERGGGVLGVDEQREVCLLGAQGAARGVQCSIARRRLDAAPAGRSTSGAPRWGRRRCGTGGPRGRGGRRSCRR